MPAKDATLKVAQAQKPSRSPKTISETPPRKSKSLKIKPAYRKKVKKTKTDVLSTSKTPSKIVHNRKEFPYGSAVSINGRDLDQQKCQIKTKPPLYSGSSKIPTSTTVERQRKSPKS